MTQVIEGSKRLTWSNDFVMANNNILSPNRVLDWYLYAEKVLYYNEEEF
jgi:hypothetical protein